MIALIDGVRGSLKTLSLIAACLCGFSSTIAGAVDDSTIEQEFRRWAQRSLRPVTSTDLSAPKSDLRALRQMVGDAKIFALSELTHGGAEVLAFRNRLFRYGVEDLGFDAIVIESGTVEGRVVNDFVVDGKGDLNSAVKKGISWTVDRFRQNRELVAWIKEHNDRLPRGARKVRFYGFDVPGSPGNTIAKRGMNTALLAALEYLHAVDPAAAKVLEDRIVNYLQRMTPIGYGLLSQSERDALTGAISDLISLLERRRFQYIQRSSASDYEWGHRAAIGARQVDAWVRNIPLNWSEKDGFRWWTEATQTRERSMLDNLEWIVSQLEPGSRILLFGAASHLQTEVERYESMPDVDHYRFGVYAKARFGKDYVTVLNMFGGGQVADCSINKIFDLEPPPADTAEALFGSLGAHYMLDMRTAPPRVAEWLRQPRQHWAGSAAWKMATASAFDIAYYVKTLSTACDEQ